MIIYDRKKAITTMMAKRHPKTGEVSSAPMAPSSVKDEDGNMDPRHAAAEDVISAMKEGHAGKLMEAMAAFHDLHRDHSEKAQDTEPEVAEQPDSES